MIRIAIVDDDPYYRQVLEKYICRYEEEYGEKLQVREFSDGADIVENYRAEYDIILMDIEMPFLDGMSAAEQIRKSDEEVVIIFLTNMPQYAMKGYAVDALDYVLKPINYFAFSERMKRALGRMRRREKTYVPISFKGGVHKVAVDEIYYVEVLDHDLIFHTVQGDMTVRGTMRETEEKLLPEGFFRCGKGHLVNLYYVDKCEENMVYVEGNPLPVSRAKKKELLDALNNYMNEVCK
ncbi:MAG: LytTR family DNA-binding domain-containing protein [Lachnospiraceae bacterium]|nr:LytTR family DNA-binding domain-containing protein [Lachnospiraceae bacterium]